MTSRHARILTIAASSLASTTTGLGAPIPPPLCVLEFPCRLSGTMPEFGDVTSVQLTPDGGRAVFLADKEIDEVNQLYSVPTGGGAFPVKLNVPQGRDVQGVIISPDGTRVVYRARTEAGGPLALFSVPIAGPAAGNVRLATDVPVGFEAVHISPDSRKVVFVSAARDRLKAVPVEGPASAGVRLTDPFLPGGVVNRFEISRDSHSVVYRATQDIPNTEELYRVPLTLSPTPDPSTVKLNAPFVAGRRVFSFRIAPSGTEVVYLADQDALHVWELYRVRLGGTGRVKLNRPLPAGWVVSGPGDVVPPAPATILPDSSRVVYEIHSPSVTGHVDVELYAVPIAGPASASVRLDAPPPGREVLDYRVSADSARVVYSLGEDDSTLRWLFSVPSGGPAAESVALSTPSQAEVFTLSPDSAHVVWELDLGASGPAPTLSSVPIGGPADEGVRLNGTEDPSPVPLPLIDAAYTRVVYGAAGDDGQEDLFSAPLSGSGSRYNLTRLLDHPLYIRDTLITRRRVVYRVRQGNGSVELYSSPLVPPILPPL